MKLRPCKYKEYVYKKGIIQLNSKKEAVFIWIIDCWFHQWGVDYNDCEFGTGNYSIGIIQRPDGSVEMPRADDIIFTDADFDIVHNNPDKRPDVTISKI